MHQEQVSNMLSCSALCMAPPGHCFPIRAAATAAAAEKPSSFVWRLDGKRQLRDGLTASSATMNSEANYEVWRTREHAQNKVWGSPQRYNCCGRAAPARSALQVPSPTICEQATRCPRGHVRRRNWICFTSAKLACPAHSNARGAVA
ncbi:hypothetical protein PMIN06_006962 [Paraphaeosphaeria minitans]